jgi:hypothetical protein
VAYNNQNVTLANPSGVQKSLIIPNLSPNTSYSFTITASDISGNNATNNPLIINATTTGVIGCSGTSTLAQQGSFSTGYQYSYETLGNSVKITYTLLDTDKVGVVAYLWRQSPFGEVQMTQVTGNTCTSTVTGLTQGSNINYGVKFAYQGGMSVTSYYSYQVGNNCNLGLEDIEFIKDLKYTNPATDFIQITSENNIDTIELYTLIGSKVLAIQTNTNVIDVSNISSGIYMLAIYSGNQRCIKKIVIQ